MSKEKARKEPESQAIGANSPILIDSSVEKLIHDCIGLFNCSEPGKCSDYVPCLKKYVRAEARDEMLRFDFEE
ncbi:MAG: hypothetical protein ABSA79_12165 [Candidatus Bathyarchaeia archaeon]|jgi:hypothetical protein